jgi:hypothetical protein
MIFIPGNTPSSKNSRIATAKGSFHSKAVGTFLREIGIVSYSASKKDVKHYKTKLCKFPFEDLREMLKYKQDGVQAMIGVHFVRKTRSRFDFHNICQIIFDLMVAFDVIEDDNMDCILPFPLKMNGSWYSVDKENPGVWITLMNPKEMLPDKFLPKLFKYE